MFVGSFCICSELLLRSGSRTSSGGCCSQNIPSCPYESKLFISLSTENFCKKIVYISGTLRQIIFANSMYYNFFLILAHNTRLQIEHLKAILQILWFLKTVCAKTLKTLCNKNFQTSANIYDLEQNHFCFDHSAE